MHRFLQKGFSGSITTKGVICACYRVKIVSPEPPLYRTDSADVLYLSIYSEGIKIVSSCNDPLDNYFRALLRTRDASFFIEWGKKHDGCENEDNKCIDNKLRLYFCPFFLTGMKE